MGNDFTVEARTSVYDTEKGMYVPFDISSAEDVAISIVGLYRRITGCPCRPLRSRDPIP